MNLDIRRGGLRYLSRGDGWVGLYCFSYDSHYDPANVSFGSMLACNEFVLQPGAGFGLHKHVGIEIVTRKPGYVLQIDRDCIDTCRFEALVEIGRSAAAAGDDESASHRLGEALALWHGPALVDFVFEPFARAEITRLEETVGRLLPH